MKDCPLKLLIVDDEQEACDNLNNILTQYVSTNIEIAGIAHDTQQAELLISHRKPDAIFMDIEMPVENAFRFLERIPHPYDFEIIFVTAYDEFAIRAFKLNAVDYIQKPICIEELENAMIKLQDRINYRRLAGTTDHLGILKQVINKEHPQRITLRSLNHIEVVDFKNIHFIEGQGSYCKICYTAQGSVKEITTSNIIAHYEDLLPPLMFFRVHKSYLVNCMHVTGIVKQDNYHVQLTNGAKIPVSRRRYPSLIAHLMENNFYSE